MELTVQDLSGLRAAADQIITFAGEERVLLFFGDMGAGKTTLVKELCAVLDVQDTTSSPTFSIVNEYASAYGPVYHFDFYRLKNETEALDMGYEDYFYSGAWCFVEWPEKIAGLWPESYIRVELKAGSTNERVISVRSNR